MATQMETKSRWEDDGSTRAEQELPAAKARQGNTGRRILTVLVSALVLAFIVWIPVEIWGRYHAEEKSPSTSIQTTAPKAERQTPADVDAQRP